MTSISPALSAIANAKPGDVPDGQRPLAHVDKVATITAGTHLRDDAAFKRLETFMKSLRKATRNAAGIMLVAGAHGDRFSPSHWRKATVRGVPTIAVDVGGETVPVDEILHDPGLGHGKRVSDADSQTRGLLAAAEARLEAAMVAGRTMAIGLAQAGIHDPVVSRWADAATLREDIVAAIAAALGRDQSSDLFLPVTDDQGRASGAGHVLLRDVPASDPLVAEVLPDATAYLIDCAATLADATIDHDGRLFVQDGESFGPWKRADHAGKQVWSVIRTKTVEHKALRLLLAHPAAPAELTRTATSDGGLFGASCVHYTAMYLARSFALGGNFGNHAAIQAIESCVPKIVGAAPGVHAVLLRLGRILFADVLSALGWTTGDGIRMVKGLPAVPRPWVNDLRGALYEAHKMISSWYEHEDRSAGLKSYRADKLAGVLDRLAGAGADTVRIHEVLRWMRERAAPTDGADDPDERLLDPGMLGSKACSAIAAGLRAAKMHTGPLSWGGTKSKIVLANLSAKDRDGADRAWTNPDIAHFLGALVDHAEAIGDPVAVADAFRAAIGMAVDVSGAPVPSPAALWAAHDRASGRARMTLTDRIRLHVGGSNNCMSGSLSFDVTGAGNDVRRRDGRRSGNISIRVRFGHVADRAGAIVADACDIAFHVGTHRAIGIDDGGALVSGTAFGQIAADGIVGIGRPVRDGVKESKGASPAEGDGADDAAGTTASAVVGYDRNAGRPMFRRHGSISSFDLDIIGSGRNGRAVLYLSLRSGDHAKVPVARIGVGMGRRAISGFAQDGVYFDGSNKAVKNRFDGVNAAAKDRLGEAAVEAIDAAMARSSDGVVRVMGVDIGWSPIGGVSVWSCRRTVAGGYEYRLDTARAMGRLPDGPDGRPLPWSALHPGMDMPSSIDAIHAAKRAIRVVKTILGGADRAHDKPEKGRKPMPRETYIAAAIAAMERAALATVDTDADAIAACAMLGDRDGCAMPDGAAAMLTAHAISVRGSGVEALRVILEAGIDTATIGAGLAKAVTTALGTVVRGCAAEMDPIVAADRTGEPDTGFRFTTAGIAAGIAAAPDVDVVMDGDLRRDVTTPDGRVEAAAKAAIPALAKASGIDDALAAALWHAILAAPVRFLTGVIHLRACAYERANIARMERCGGDAAATVAASDRVSRRWGYGDEAGFHAMRLTDPVGRIPRDVAADHPVELLCTKRLALANAWDAVVSGLDAAMGLGLKPCGRGAEPDARVADFHGHGAWAWLRQRSTALREAAYGDIAGHLATMAAVSGVDLIAIEALGMKQHGGASREENGLAKRMRASTWIETMVRAGHNRRMPVVAVRPNWSSRERLYMPDGGWLSIPDIPVGIVHRHGRVLADAGGVIAGAHSEANAAATIGARSIMGAAWRADIGVSVIPVDMAGTQVQVAIPKEFTDIARSKADAEKKALEAAKIAGGTDGSAQVGKTSASGAGTKGRAEPEKDKAKSERVEPSKALLRQATRLIGNGVPVLIATTRKCLAWIIENDIAKLVDAGDPLHAAAVKAAHAAIVDAVSGSGTAEIVVRTKDKGAKSKAVQAIKNAGRIPITETLLVLSPTAAPVDGKRVWFTVGRLKREGEASKKRMSFTTVVRRDRDALIAAARSARAAG